MSGCERCDDCGGRKTYTNQAKLALKGRVVCIDWCIHHIVAALNAGGVETVACCCGHGKQLGRIDLADGRILQIFQSCCVCTKPVDPREAEDGGDDDGSQLSDGRWVCSHECWNKAVADAEKKGR